MRLISETVHSHSFSVHAPGGGHFSAHLVRVRVRGRVGVMGRGRGRGRPALPGNWKSADTSATVVV